MNLPCSKMVGFKIGKEQTENQKKKKERKKERKTFQRQNNILNSNKILHKAMPATDSGAGCARHKGSLAAEMSGAKMHPKLCTRGLHLTERRGALIFSPRYCLLGKLYLQACACPKRLVDVLVFNTRMAF